MENKLEALFLILILAEVVLPVSLYAQSGSLSYKLLDSYIAPGILSTSSHYSLQGTVVPSAGGASVSAGSKLFSGFLYFPYVTTPIVVATGGSAQAVISWTAADSGVGFAVGGYSVGMSITSGGPYTYSHVGNVLSYTSTGLTNGTLYYFVVRVLDGLGNTIATSTQATATPVAPPAPLAGGGGGGGGGASPTITTGATVIFSGRAYPGSAVTILKDAQVAVTTVADLSANFKVSVGNLTPGNYFFSAYSEDNAGQRSSMVTFPVSISASTVTNIAGIFITPTIGVDKTEVKRGDNIAIFGRTSPTSEVTIQVNSDVPYFAKAKADKDGAYIYNFDTSPLDYGDHSTKSKSSVEGEISSYSSAAAFKVGNQSIFKSLVPAKVAIKKGDVSGDGKINLVDYSIVAYWYNRLNPPAKADFNGDGKVNLVDFSILAYNWTG